MASKTVKRMAPLGVRIRDPQTDLFNGAWSGSKVCECVAEKADRADGKERLIRDETSQNRQPCRVVHAVLWRSVWDSSRSSMFPDLRPLSMLLGEMVVLRPLSERVLAAAP
jgi:hypothetical protein